jgi:hypothetical protein
MAMSQQIENNNGSTNRKKSKRAVFIAKGNGLG